MALNFLVADNDPQGILCQNNYLQKEFSCTLNFVHNEEDLLQKAAAPENSVLFFDLRFPVSTDAIVTLTQLKEKFQHITILPLVPENLTEMIRELLGLQFFFYLVKPLDRAELTITLKRALESIVISTTKQISEPVSSKQKKGNFQGMIGSSVVMSQLFDIIDRVAEDDFSTVLIRGESGTGKEMVAKAIHQQSARKKHNFVPVNCAAIPDELLESELFGYTRGAFTGATTNKQGRIQYADKGVLFLDEIGDMKPSLQAKLLRVLQEREFEPVGGFKPTPVNTRILAATHCNLEQLVEQGKFREDLYYRLSVIPLTIPPLRERKEDIAPLIELFIEQYTTKRGREPFSFSAQSCQALMEHNWKGNVRELENLIQHMAVLYSGNVVEHHQLPIKFQMQREIAATPSVPKQDKWSTHETAELANAFSSAMDERSMLLSDTMSSPDNSLSSASPTAIEEEEHPLPQAHKSPEKFADRLTEHNRQPLTDNTTILWSEGVVNFKELVDNFEDQLIIQAMQLTRGNKKKAAEILTLKRTTLLEKIKKKGLQDAWQTESSEE